VKLIKDLASVVEKMEKKKAANVLKNHFNVFKKKSNLELRADGENVFKN
jgi:hypothetical protein